MDGRASSAHDAPAASPPLAAAASSGRKPKAKAPLPPTDTKNVEVSSAEDSVESASFIMEQKENMLDRDIELSVVLPGDIIKSATVHGSKPMMDLLIFLCAQYHLNPSSYTIDLLSAEKNPIKFKPNTPIGMLEAEKVVLKPKVLDKKKPTPIIPEKTVRVVINFKKTQKAIVRVNPHASLQELTPIICSKCDFDPSHTLLLKDYQSQEPLDLTKSLNDLGLRELYAMDISRAASATAFNKSSLQESCQIPQNLDFMKEKENKGFFSFFQRSKKKREQTASAPATPLINKHRPTFARSNTISKPYISNTLPSEAPKKRRAPLPPMPASQSEPHDLARIQEGPASRMVKSTSADENNKSPGGADIMRTGSLSSTSTGNSSLKRMKRKAPSPPSKIPSHQSVENSPVTVPQSEDGVPADGASEASSPGALSSPAGISSDYSLEEIDEKEELREVPKDEAENISLKSPDSSVVSTDVINALKNDPDSIPDNEREEASQNDKEEKQKTGTTDGQESHTIVHDTSNGGIAMDTVTNLKSLGSNQENVVPNGVAVFATNIEDNIKKRENSVGSVAKGKDVDMEVNRQRDHPGFKSHSALGSKENDLAASPGQKPSQPTAEKTTMQDAAIQTAPSSSNFTEDHQDENLSTFKVDEIVQTSNSRSTQHLALSPHNSVDISNEFGNQDTLAKRSEGERAMKVPVSAHNNEDHLLLTNKNVKNSPASSLKNHPLYRQDYNPKPKPSNEITREYIPKIGMTTYKIVPPKSLEISKDWESETVGYKDDQKLLKLDKRHVNENVKETAIQTEGLVISEGPKEPPPDLKPKPSLRAEQQVPRAVNSPVGATANPLKPPRMTRDSGLAPFAPNLEDIHNILETKFKPRISNPQAKPSSFFLQMQKRASGQYVTSAAAKSVPATPTPTSTPKELANKEVERDALPPPEQTLSPLSKTTLSAPQPQLKNPDGDIISQKAAEASLPPPPPPVAPKPMSLPTSQGAALNLKTLKTFGAPRPFSSSAPSPFALAVVKRSQSFTRERAESCSDNVSAPAAADSREGAFCSANTVEDTPQLDVVDKENKSAHNKQNSKEPTATDSPSFTLKRQSSLPLQSSDPEQIRQSLLTAIRTGEAAARLKRVTVPSNTISVNGRSGLGQPMSPDAQHSC